MAKLCNGLDVPDYDFMDPIFPQADGMKPVNPADIIKYITINNMINLHKFWELVVDYSSVPKLKDDVHKTDNFPPFKLSYIVMPGVLTAIQPLTIIPH